MNTNQKISLDNAVAGMVLSTDLLRSSGEIVLPAGAVLSDTLISSLKRHQFNEISIVINDPQAAQEEIRRLEKKIERVHQLFKVNENETLNQQFKNYLLGYLTAEKHEQD